MDIPLIDGWHITLFNPWLVGGFVLLAIAAVALVIRTAK